MTVIDVGKNRPMPMQGQQKPLQMNIDLKNCEEIRCPSCNSDIFIDATQLKYISPLQSPTGKPTVAAIMVGKICANCNEVFNPDVWKRNKKIQTEIKDKP